MLGKRLPLPFHNLNFLLEGVTTKTMNSVSEVFLRRTTCYNQSQFAVTFERVAYVLNIDLRTTRIMVYKSMKYKGQYSKVENK